MIEIEIDLRPLERALRDIHKAARDRVIQRSLNRAMDGMYIEAKRGVPKQTRILQKDATAALRKIPASKGQLEARVVAKDRWKSASYKSFAMKQGATGSAFTPWKGRQFVQGGFIARMSSGHVSIFVRQKTNTWRRGPNRSQGPIHDVGWGPNVAREMVRQDQPTAHKITSEARVRFETQFLHQLDREIKRAKSRQGL